MHIEGDEAKCEAARAVIKNIDWECTIETLFREKNKSTKFAVPEALDWFFSKVEEGIILEDDCVPVDGFRDQMAAAISAAPRCHYKDGNHCPAPIVSAYLGTGYPRYWQPGIGKAIQKADALNAPWILSEHLLHAVAYAGRGLGGTGPPAGVRGAGGRWGGGCMLRSPAPARIRDAPRGWCGWPDARRSIVWSW